MTPEDSLASALEIGVMISCVLFGVVTLQVYDYYKEFPEDRLFLKCFVCGLFSSLVITHSFIQVGVVW
jgi:hypothetical protein